MTTGVVANSATRTNPVANTPTSDPAVARAESRPTTRPVWSRASSCTLTTSGVAALSSADGAKNPSAARKTMADGVGGLTCGPSARMIGTAAIDAAPPRTSAPGSRRRGSARSASHPPIHVPVAMPARTTPMIPVNVSSDTPDVGREQAPGEDLQHEHRARRDEHDGPGESAVHRPDRNGG